MRSWDLQAVETIFAAAAVDASLWSKAIQTASEQTESIGALILPVTGQGIPYVPASEGLRAPLKSISATAGASVTFASPAGTAMPSSFAVGKLICQLEPSRLQRR